MKEILVRAGENHVVIKRQFSSVPMTYRFGARPANGDGGGEPRGSLEIRRSQWVFPQDPVDVELHTENTVEAGFWDTFVTVTVRADEDLIISSSRLEGRSLLPILVIALAIVVAALAVFLLLLN